MPPTGKHRHVYRSWATQVVSGDWDIDRIYATVRLHEMGQFQQSALLIDAMGRDDRIVSALETLILGVLRLPFKIDPANDTDEAIRCRTALDLVWRRVFAIGKLYDALLWLVMAGFAILELDWDMNDPSTWTLERAHVWHLQFISWDESKRLFILQTTEGAIEVDPENPDGKFIFISAGGDRPWMRGVVRSVGDDFVAIDEAVRDWRRHSEVHGGGIMLAEVPIGLGDDADKNRYLESVANMGSDPVVECPKNAEGEGYGLSILETGKDHAAGFALLIDRLIANVNVRILGQNASTENSGPYVAAGGLFAKVTLDRIDSVVTPLEEAFLFQVCRPFAEFNFGDPNLAPIPSYDSEPPPDKNAQAQTMATVATAVATLKTAGFLPDAEELTNRYGFKLTATTTGTVQFFAYDLAEGVVTINEYRKSKGLPPVPWGEQTSAERKAELERLAAAPAPAPAPAEGAAA